MTIFRAIPLLQAVALVLCIAHATHATAGVAPVPGSNGNAPEARGLGEIDSIDARALQASPRTGRTLRCWQKGKLIIERQVAQLPIEEDKTVNVPAAGGRSLRLYDLDNSTCLVE